MWTYNYTNPEIASDELMHYGIIGMKWGIHRSREVRAAKAAYKANRKKASSRAEKMKLKAKYKRDRLNAADAAADRIFKDESKATRRRVNRTGALKTAAQSYLLGDQGALQYQRSRAKGSGRVGSAVLGTAVQTGHALTGGVNSVVGTVRALERSDFGKKKKKR